ncbi:hypothetical protein ACJMK2_037639 [Sinanodonta woodiana]|uniref:BTB domain-containing protein n=1 Tax=Sinanodonta woodiana TaxID=1069815 RepID=A0ABD3WPK7_SINWO
MSHKDIDDLSNLIQPGSNSHSVIFRHESHDSILMREMKKLYDENLLIDVTLSVEEFEISCHKNVLASLSPYFRLMFTLDLLESKQNRIELHGVDAKSVKYIIEYAYTGKLKITRSNAQNLLAATSLFQILPVQRACARFMETQLDVQNCVGIHYFAHIHSCYDLKQKARECIEKYFSQVCKCEEFMSLSYDKVREIIMSDELNVESEETVLDSVIDWVKHNERDRKYYVGELLPHVRLGLVSSKYVKQQILENSLFQKDDVCQSLIRDFLDFEARPGSYNGSTEFSITLRSGMFQPENCLVFVGGKEPTNARPCINCYNPVTREAFYIEDFPEDRASGCYDVEDMACVVTKDNTLFAGGGIYIYHQIIDDSEDDSFEELEYKEHTVQKDFFQYDNDHNEWIQKSPMLFPKSNFTLAELNGKIYCFGGLTENKHPTEIVEVYDIEKNRWNYHGMLPTTLVDLSSVVYQNHIYLLGGRTGVGAHNNLLRYDPEQEEWTSLAGMLTPRFNFGASVVDGEIYVAGGQIYSHATYTISREVLRTVEIYNMGLNQWRQGPELPQELCNVCMTVFNGAIYASGTCNCDHDVTGLRHNKVCRLDLGTNQWKVVEEDLNRVRNFRCSAVKLHTRKLPRVFRQDVDT